MDIIKCAVFKKLFGGASGGGGLAINGIIREYQVNAGKSVSAGDFVEFVTKFGNGELSESYTPYIKACKLDNEKVLIAYAESGNSNYGTAVVLKISGGAIIKGTETVFNSTTTTWISTVALTDNKVLVAYKYSGDSKYGKAIILTIDDITITVGTETTFVIDIYNNLHYISTVALSDSKVLVAYQCDNKNHAIILTINGTAITTGIAVVFFGNANSKHISTVALTESKVFVVYANYANVLTISDTTITVGKSTTFEQYGISSCHSAVALNDSKVVLAYLSGNDNKNYARLFTIDGTTITKGTAISFGGNKGSVHISTVALSDSKVLVAYQDGNNSKYGTAIVLSIDDTNITAGTKTVFDFNTTAYTSLIAFSETSAFVAYTSGEGASEGTVSVNDAGAITLGAPAGMWWPQAGVAYKDKVAVNGAEFVINAKAFTFDSPNGYAGIHFSAGKASDFGAPGILGARTYSIVVPDLMKSFSFTIYGTTLKIRIEGAGGAYDTGIAITPETDVTVKFVVEDDAIKFLVNGEKIQVGGIDIAIPAAGIIDADGKAYLALSAVGYGDTGTEAFTVKTINGVAANKFGLSFDLDNVGWEQLTAANVDGVGAYSDLTIDGTTITAGGAENATYIQLATTNLHNVGIAKTAGNAGETVEVYCAV